MSIKYTKTSLYNFRWDLFTSPEPLNKVSIACRNEEELDILIFEFQKRNFRLSNGGVFTKTSVMATLDILVRILGERKYPCIFNSDGTIGLYHHCSSKRIFWFDEVFSPYTVNLI